MAHVSLVARGTLDYAGQRIGAGQAFSATAEDARLLLQLSLVDPTEPDTPPSGSPEQDSEPVSTPRPKRAYRRRDLHAEP